MFVKKKSSMKFPKLRAEMSTQEKILFLVKSRKAVTLTGIAGILGKTKSTISEHLDKLSNEGRLHLHRKGKENIIYFGRFKGAKKKR
jgi:predicted ArsR family transcriptional regulator